MTESIYPHSIDSLFAATGVGSLDRALTNNMYGINHMQIPGMVSSNRDQQGYLFMTRPQLNLQDDNVRNMRELYPLLTGNDKSLAFAIRMLLDPRLGAGYRFKTTNGYTEIPPVNSPLLDNNNCFIPFVTNNLISVSGWPDESIPTSSSDPGLHKQVFTLPDGLTRNFGEYDVSINVQNTMGDPLSLMLHVWLHYMSAVKEGRMDPYHDYILNDRLDFNTRLYRVVLDHRREKVTKIFSCIAGFPTSNPTGMFADYNRDTPFSQQTKEISFRVKCTGFVAYDPLLVKNFNDVVNIFNVAMTENNRKDNMILLKRNMLRVFNHRAYPRINPDTTAMEWWVPANLYEQYLKESKNDFFTTI